MNSVVVYGASGRTGQEVVTQAIAHRVKIQDQIRGSDAVVIVFGPRPPYTDIFCAQKTQEIIQTMKKERVSRLICQTGAMIGDYPQNRSFLFDLFSKRFRYSNPEGYKDRVEQEAIVKNSGLDWTIIKPPRLTSEENGRPVLAGEKIKVGLLSSIPRKNLAKFIIDELLTPSFVHKTIFVKI